MSAYKRASFVGIVLFLIGVGLAIYGGKFYLEQQDLEKNGIKVKGKVIRIGEKAIYRFAIVAFKTTDGQEIIFKNELEQNVDIFPYKLGQEVSVIYHKNDPKNAKIDDFWNANFLPIYLGIVGGFLVIFGLFLRWLFLRKARRYRYR